MSLKITPKDWKKLQHYHTRRPPWIKLHSDLLDDFAFQCLPIASKALAPMLWLLASRSENAEIDADPKVLAFKLRMDVKDVVDGLKPLISAGLFVDASGVLAECLQDACPERERETETEREKEVAAGAATTPASPPREKKQTFRKWLESLKANGETPVPENDPVFDYAEESKLPQDFLGLAWQEFKARYADDSKLYTDWRRVFRRAVRENWFGLWYCNGTDGYVLTTKGMQAQNAYRARAAA